MKTRSLISISTFILMFTAGCNPSLPSRALVDDLRVLGVRAEPPEAAPGQTITFDALVGDVEVPVRPYRNAWAICTPDEEGVATCANPARVMVLGTGSTATWTVPLDMLDGLTAEQAAIGRDVFVVFGIELDGIEGPPREGEHDVAFKRVRISTSPSPNRNPRIDALLLDGTASDSRLRVDPGSTAELLVLASPDSREPYEVGGEPQQEETRYTWLITRGSVGDAVSWGDEDGVSQTYWDVPKSGDPDLMLWVVLRDERGGTAWASQRVRLAE